ncbi:hypothetical protein Zmor_020696 [Zophobas morio]|uniref:DUF4536 domain-containing protein n=1 Tax=Zophobas morio TaxID=2755281 RepID=A0AA38I847_9CUCU|nr:hypothetical protein Zmor_020696 [Zophobas morio]
MQNNKEYCLSCKITSICCLTGIGTYLIYHGRQPLQKHKFSLIFLGLGCVGLGIGEIFDKSPFRNYKDIHE